MGLGGNTMLSRALMSGGLNLGSQLAQEGSDGDFSALSLAMASGIGALSAPNAASTIRGVDPNFVGPRPAAEGILGQGKEYLARGAEFLGPQTGGVTDILGKGGTQAGLNMETLKAASIPFTQGTTDLAVAENRRAMRDYERELADYEAGVNEDTGNRALAIRQSMEAYGFPEDEILAAIEAAGYANGGRVGLANGGDLKEAALNNILYRFGGKYDRPTSSGDSLEDKITEKQLGDVLKYDFQGPAGVMGLEESLDMITPESVSRSAMKIQRDGDPDFGGIPAAVEGVEEKPKEFLVDKLKVTVQPGQSEQMAIMNAMMNDIDEVMPEDRKMEFYKLYLPQLKASGEISEKEYEGLMGELFGEGKAEGGRIGFDNGGFEPFKYTSKIPRVLKEDPFGSDPLGSILNMSYTVRAPLIDIIRTVAKTATEATKLAAAAVKLGYDVTEPVREVVGDVAGGIYDIAKKSVQESGDASRFIQPTYYLERFGPEKNLTDDETRLKRLKRSIGRDDRDLIKTIENRIFAYDDAGMNQNEEDKKVSNKIQTKIDERNFGFADGGLMNLGGREMDMRTGGFIPIGKKERADDVPARLSKNEFVMTADAVRAAGGGSVNEGARRMYNLMNNLEARV
jgi:hypothetical protein